jgi:Ca-activated chloride channel family protein
MTRRLLPVLLVACLSGTGIAARLADRQEPTFRSTLRTVPVYVTATDAGGRLITDLERDDFEVLDNGTPQPITVFSRETQPISIVLMLDRSGSMVGNFERVRAAAEQFVFRLLPADQARIGSFAARVQVDPLSFTDDRDQLIAILRRDLQAPGPTPLWNAVSVGMTALSHQQGRRVVLVFTDGVDHPPTKRSTNMTLDDVVTRARDEHVMVYAIGLASSMGPGPTGGSGRFVPGRGSGGRGVTDKPDPGLAKLAAESGGGYFELTDSADLSATFARVADELHRQYALGFVPEKLDGKTHRIDVGVRRPGVTARARTSYRAS